MSDARTEMQHLANDLSMWAIARFDRHGPHDARGAALWDAAEHIEEAVIPSLAAEETE